MIRPANENDIQALCWMARRFVEESDLPFTYNYLNSYLTFHTYINSHECIVLVDEYEDELCGGIMGALDADFVEEKVAYVTKMYVETEFRGLGTARDLVKAFEVEAKSRGASMIFASSTAGMGERVEKLFVRLFERYGFRQLGRVVVKEV